MNQRDEELLGALALGELTAAEATELDIVCGADPEVAAARAEMLVTADLLAAASTVEPPRPEVRDAIFLNPLPGQAGTKRARPEGRPWAWRVLSGLVGAAALAVAFTVLPAVLGPTTFTVEASATELAPGASGTLTFSDDGKTIAVDLVVKGLPQLAEGAFYECWWTDDAGTKFSAGTFRVDENGDAHVQLSALSVPAKLATIVLEPPDGDPASSGMAVLRFERIPTGE